MAKKIVKKQSYKIIEYDSALAPFEGDIALRMDDLRARQPRSHA